MTLTWEQLKKTPQLNLNLELLEEIRDNLRNGKSVRIGESILTREDISDVQNLIDREDRNNGGK